MSKTAIKYIVSALWSNIDLAEGLLGAPEYATSEELVALAPELFGNIDCLRIAHKSFSGNSISTIFEVGSQDFSEFGNFMICGTDSSYIGVSVTAIEEVHGRVVNKPVWEYSHEETDSYERYYSSYEESSY